jgi:surface antigen
MHGKATVLLLMLLAACARDQPNLVAGPVLAPEALAMSPSGGGAPPAPDTLLPADVVAELPPEDRAQAAESLRQALEADRGQRIDWHDTATGGLGHDMEAHRWPYNAWICREKSKTFYPKPLVWIISGSESIPI